MCKPTCCSNDSSSGLGIAIAALIGLAAIVAVARPVIHAAEEILKITLIAASVLALVTVIILVIRSRRTNEDRWTPIHLRQWSETIPQSRHVSEIEPGRWPSIDPGHQLPTGLQPGYGNAAALHRTIQAALEDGQQVIIIDGKNIRTWS